MNPVNFKRLFAKAVVNWPAKVLCIGLAMILFIFNRMSNLESRFFSAPLVVEHMGVLMPSQAYPRMVRVTLRGEANSIFPVLEDDIEVFVRMENYTSPGTYSVPVQWRKKGTALGSDALQVTVDPAEISFTLDYKISKFTPIVPSFRGQVESGYTLTSYTFDPNQVIIDGPADLMANIFELYTELIDLDGRNSNFSIVVNVQQANPLVVFRGPGTSVFSGIISQLVPVRNILNVPIVVTGLMEGLIGELEINAVNVHLEAANWELADSFSPEPDFLKVDCSAITEPGNYILRVQPETMEGIWFRVSPGEVRIIITAVGEEL